MRTMSERILTVAGRLPRAAAIAIAACALGCTLATVLVAGDASRDRQNRDVRAEIAEAAARNVTTILSYRADSLQADLRDGLAVTTDPFRSTLSRTMTEVISPAAADGGITTKAKVLATGVVTNDSDSAEVVLFVNQETTSTTQQEPQVNRTTLTVDLVRSGGSWLVSTFEQS